MIDDVRSRFFLSQNEPSLRRPCFNPLLTAGVLAAGYFVFCSFYIWVSGIIAAQFSESIADLQKIETIKGILFISITTLVLFSVLLFFLKRLHADEVRLIQQQNELIISQRESVAGIFASSVAHDINNIIMVLNYYCHVISTSDSDTSEYEKAVTETKLVLNELKELANRLMQVGKGNLPGTFSNFDLAELARSTIRFTRKHNALYQRTLNYQGCEHLDVYANESALRQVLINLILNAAQAVDKGGEIRVLVDKTDEGVLIEVHDSGPGVEPGMRDRIFEAFSTTRNNGFGLGLTSVKVYTDMHNGKVKVGESDLGGACFRISLPLKKTGSAVN